MTAQEGTETATQYTYDVFGKQTTVVGEGLSAAYTYYPDDLRKTKTINGITTTYVWDGDQIVLELTAGAVRKYIRGLQLIACVSGDNTSYYHHDAHGNVVQLSDASGAVTRTYEYDAFGEQLNIDTTDANPFRYCGEYYDAETGTYYLRARYYAADLGRFTQWDSYAGDTTKPVSLNHYIYCYDDPIKYRDFNGNIPIDTFFDLASFVASAIKFVFNPSWENAGYVAWDATALFLPYVTGSYSAKGIKILDTASDFAKRSGIISNAADTAELFLKNRKSIIGSYRDLRKTTQSLGIKGYQVHHLIEKRFASKLGFSSTDDILSVMLTKSEHDKITKELRRSIGYSNDKKGIRTDTATPNQIWSALCKVYRENKMDQYLPLLKDEIENNAKYAYKITNWQGVK